MEVSVKRELTVFVYLVPTLDTGHLLPSDL